MGERLSGRVASGLGDLAHWMRVHADAYRAAAGCDLYPGSLNVILDQDWQLPPSPRIRVRDAGVGMTLVPCWVGGHPAFVARTDRNEAGVGRHPRSVIEVVARVRLRDRLALSDGDPVELVVPRPHDPAAG